MKLPETFTPDKKNINVVIETPRGNSNKYTYFPENDFFKITKVLPAGTVFPWDFGFIPGTKGDDGDPLDALVFMDTPTFTGCIVESRLIGVIKAVQTEDGKKERNDRIIAVSAEHDNFSHIDSLEDLNQKLLDELARFFDYYNAMSGKKFKVTGRDGPKKAQLLIEKQLEKT
jgi:inorganic pyrophosphatase